MTRAGRDADLTGLVFELMELRVLWEVPTFLGMTPTLQTPWIHNIGRMPKPRGIGIFPMIQKFFRLGGIATGD
jgi:hypothetical protein